LNLYEVPLVRAACASGQPNPPYMSKSTTPPAVFSHILNWSQMEFGRGGFAGAARHCPRLQTGRSAAFMPLHRSESQDQSFVYVVLIAKRHKCRAPKAVSGCAPSQRQIFRRLRADSTPGPIASQPKSPFGNDFIQMSRVRSRQIANHS
jgi:hypothetical protein